MDCVRVRYVVDDVDKAIDFYTHSLDFDVELHPAPGFAALRRGNLRLLLNAPGAGGAGQPSADGTKPSPGGGWNRVQIEVDDLDGTYASLRGTGAHFRSEPIEGKGGRQVLLEDPAGNPIELFEPADAPESVPPRRSIPPIPEGHHTVAPFFVVKDVGALVGFIEEAFGGRVRHAMRSDDGVLRHAVVVVGDSTLMISKGAELYDERPLTLHLYVDNVDRTYAKALVAGAGSLEAPADQFYGDRRAGVKDAWTNHWWIATHVEDVDDDDLAKREAAFRRARAIR